MKSAIGRLVIAAVLFGAGAVVWAEARYTRSVAREHERLVTLHYDAGERIEQEESWLDRLSLSQLSLTSDVRRQRTIGDYFRGNYAVLRPGAVGGDAPAAEAAADPQRRFYAANAAFRAAQGPVTDRTAALAALDSVVQSYAEVLRSDPSNADAAYNFEFVVRYRDRLARQKPAGRGVRPAAVGEAPTQVDIPSADLPVGPTIHGMPGGPPPELPGDQFKTLAPMPYEEREETDPGAGVTPRRRG
jgi:hypothetical protein